jgi:hypothetical protein
MPGSNSSAEGWPTARLMSIKSVAVGLPVSDRSKDKVHVLHAEVGEPTRHRYRATGCYCGCTLPVKDDRVASSTNLRPASIDFLELRLSPDCLTTSLSLWT